MSARVDDFLRDAAAHIGDVLASYGARIARGGSPEHGRATCPVHQGDSPSLSYSNGRACCHSSCATGWDTVGLVMEIERLDFLPAVARLAEILGWPNPTTADAPVRVVRPAPRSPEPIAPTRDAAALWNRLALHDAAGEDALLERGLLPAPLLSDVLRFNVGASRDQWLDAAARAGFRIAFAVRSVTGKVQTITLRHVGEGAPWGPDGEVKKKLLLPGLSSSGSAICRPELALLAAGECRDDEVIFVEGGTDWLAATISSDAAALEEDAPPAWALGVIGVGSTERVLRAFAPVLRGRVVRVAFDSDAAGESAAELASRLAYELGAREVRRYRPASKDLADDLARAIAPRRQSLGDAA